MNASVDIASQQPSSIWYIRVNKLLFTADHMRTTKQATCWYGKISNAIQVNSPRVSQAAFDLQMSFLQYKTRVVTC